MLYAFLIVLLLPSIAANIILYKYIRKIFEEKTELLKGIIELEERLYDFSEYAEEIYKLEEYYGDETIRIFLDRIKDLRKYVETFEKTVYEIDEESPDETEKE